jgi:ABC-2 type transport system permease protein
MLTMRLFAEEKKSGTIELLLTYPERDGEVLLGKYLAALALFAVLLALTLVYPGLVSAFTRVEWGPVLTGYLGLLLTGATFLAVGVLVSSLTENQIVAGFGAFGILLAFWIVGWGAEWASGNLRAVLQYVSIPEHIDGFSRGVIDTKDVVYYLSAIGLALFLTLRSLDSKRWRG